MNHRLTEYHLQLASFNNTRRLWAEYYLDIPRPPEQQELDLMRRVLNRSLISHLKETELHGRALFRAAPLEDGNGDVVRKEIVSALKAGKAVVNSDIEVGGVCLWIPAVELDKENGVFNVHAFAGNPLAESSLRTTFENPARVLASAFKEFSDSEEWGLKWPRVNVEVQPWAPTGHLSKTPCVRFMKHGNSFLVGSDVFKEVREKLLEALSNPLEPPESGNLFLPMDAAFLTEHDLPYLKPLAGHAPFIEVPVSLASCEDRFRGWPARELITMRAEAFCGHVLPADMATERAVFLSAARAPVSASKDFASPRTGIGLLTARYLLNGREEERVFTFEEMARGRDSFFDFCKCIRERTIVLSPGVYEWNNDLCEALSLVSQGLIEGVKEPCELHDCYAHFDLRGNAQSPESFAKAFRFSLPPPSKAFVTGENSTALELVVKKTSLDGLGSFPYSEGSYGLRALERCRWETKVFMHAWQQIEKRIAIMLGVEGDLERTIDGGSWKLIESAKIDAALAAGEECKTCTRALATGRVSMPQHVDVLWHSDDSTKFPQRRTLE